MTTAGALRPDFGTDEYAIRGPPGRRPQHENPGKGEPTRRRGGQRDRNTSTAYASSIAVCATAVMRTMPILPRKYETGGIGVPRRRLRMPSSSLERDRDGQCLEVDQEDPGGDHPLQEVLREVDCRATVSTDRRFLTAEDH